MPNAVPAAAPGLPTARRTFLRQLCGLPLIGGGLTLIGAPSAVAEPVTYDLMEAYKTWLHYEQRFLCWEMAADPVCIERYRPFDGRDDRIGRSRAMESQYSYIGKSGSYHGPRAPEPSTRAALVLSAVGCDWREG